MPAGDQGRPDLARIRQLARELAATDSGPAAELACALADAVDDIAGRVDALWDLITSVATAAGLTPEAGAPPRLPAGEPLADRPSGSDGPPAEFVRALSAPRAAGPQGIRLRIGGQDWVATLSQDQRPADPARAWTALEHLAAQPRQAAQAAQAATTPQAPQVAQAPETPVRPPGAPIRPSVQVSPTTRPPEPEPEPEPDDDPAAS